jgi:large subunit ribosomal protein L35
MPKMKTDRGAAKRIKITGRGRLRRGQAFRNHLLEKKASTRTRRLSREVDVAPADVKAVKRLLGI